MTCNEFETQIGSFISGDMNYELIREFISHLYSCNDCCDDLEIYYITNIGFEKVEKEDSISYNFKGELKQIIGNYEKILKRWESFNKCTRAVTVLANIIVLVVLVIGLLTCFDIL